MAVLRFTHVGICVTDLVRASRFYRDVLGFTYLSALQVGGEPASTLLRLDNVELSAVYLERDGARIELLRYHAPGHEGDGRVRPMNQLGLTHLSLRVDNLGEMLSELRRVGVNVLGSTHIDIADHET